MIKILREVEDLKSKALTKSSDVRFSEAERFYFNGQAKAYHEIIRVLQNRMEEIRDSIKKTIKRHNYE